MKSPRSLRLVMAPLVCSLTLSVLDAASAAPLKKSPLAPAPALVETPAPKRSILQKLNPFHKKEPPPAPIPPPVPPRNSKKSGAAPVTSATPASPLLQPSAPAKPLVKAAVLPPAPPSGPMTEEPRKAGFFSRLKAKLDHDPDTVAVAEKPARPADWKDRWVVTEDSTGFFEYGPSQASGPDLRLSRGQVVKLAQTTRGWARVELEDGRQGYIGSDQMRQAAQTDFAEPMLPATQLAAIGAGLQGWSPAPPPPDLPDLPMAPGMEDALLLLPPLEFEGTELKKSSLKLKPLGTDAPTLQPGDALPPSPAPEPPVLELEKAPALPSIPAPTEPAPEPSPPAPATEPPAPSPSKPTLPS